MQVREYDQDERAGLHPHFAEWLGPEVQCSAGAFWPSRGQLARADLVFVAELDGQPVGAFLTPHHGFGDWLLTKPGHTAAAFAALIPAVYARCGACGGRVSNAALRARYVAAGGGHVVEDEHDPTLLCWVP